MPEPRRLPEGSRLLHVGPPKTGSTALQDSLHQARPSLARQGVVYVSRVRHEAVPARWITGRMPRTPKNDWAKQRWIELAEALRANGPERKVYSSEYLSDAGDDQIVEILDAVGVDQTYVVVTLRPLADLVPSQYQQYLQGGLTAEYEAWLDATFNGPPTAGPTPGFWRRHRHDELVARWARLLGPDRVIVVVVDGRDLAVVPSSFEGLLGLARGTLAGRTLRANRSLTWPEAEVMRRFNLEARRTGLVDARYETLTKYAADRIKERVPGADEPRIVTPAWAVHRANELGAEFVAGIAASGVRVLGDLDALAPVAATTALSYPPETVDLDLAALFAAGFVEAERRLRREAAARKAARRGGQVTSPRRRAAGSGRDAEGARRTA